MLFRSGFLVYDDEERGGATAKMFTQVTNIDVHDKEQVWGFSCKLADVGSIKDLADMLPLDYKTVESLYNEHVDGIRNTGGVEAMLNHLQMRVRIIALGLQYNLTDMDFTKVPLKADRESLLSFFGTLSSEFGSNFLDWVYHRGEFRDMTKVFVLDGPEKFVDALLESENLDKAAKKMGFDRFKTWAMLRSLGEFVKEKHGSYISYIKLVQALQAYGLYDLRP